MTETAKPYSPGEARIVADEWGMWDYAPGRVEPTLRAYADQCEELARLRSSQEKKATENRRLANEILDVHDALHRECNGSVSLPVEIRVLRARMAECQSELDRALECIADSGGDFEAWKVWHAPATPAKFYLDGSDHYSPAERCCVNFGTECPKCGGWRHHQPGYGGYIDWCERCDGIPDAQAKEG